MGKSWVDSQTRFPRGKVRVRIKKRPLDPEGVVRIHAGGAPEISGYYCHYRGTKEQVIVALERCLEDAGTQRRAARRNRTMESVLNDVASSLTHPGNVVPQRFKSRLRDRLQAVHPCYRCASSPDELKGLWVRNDDGLLIRCGCLRGRLLSTLDQRAVSRAGAEDFG